MKPVDFPESNLTLIKPDNMTDEECSSLKVWRGEGMFVSCWEPTSEELAEINKTGKIWLSVWGDTTPPIAAMGINPFLPTKEQLFNYMDAVHKENKSLPDGAWECILQDAVTTFNQVNGTDFDPFDSWNDWINDRGTYNE